MLLSNFGLLSNSVCRYWTQSAIDCYNRHCICSGCETGKIIGVKNCQMKKVVINLVRLQGTPPQKSYDDICPGATQVENEVINAILNGSRTVEEIADTMGKAKSTIITVLIGLYAIAETNGCEFKNGSNKLPDLITFILSKNTQEEDNTNILKGEALMYDEDLKLKYPNSIGPIVAAVKKGYTRPTEIAKETAFTLVSVNTRFFEFAKYLKTHGLILGNDNKSNRERVVDFIQSRLLDNDYIEQPKTQERPARVIPKEDVAEAKNESDYLQLKTENEQLKARIKELENQPAKDVLSPLKDKLRAQIAHLTNKLNLIETLEKELAEC